MSVDNLLSRLNKVRRLADGQYMACCPSHADRSASLSIRDIGDGRILINCFAGCDTYGILRNLGLDWDDVLPEKSVEHRAKKIDQVIYATEALKVIQFEARIIMVCAYDMTKGNVPTSEEMQRVETAMKRINLAIQGAGQ